MVKFIIFCLLLIAIAFGTQHKLKKDLDVEKNDNPTATNSDSLRLENNIRDARAFLQDHPEYNQQIVFLVDMKKPITKNRFYVYDVLHHALIDKGLVAHGSGSVQTNSNQLTFSNVEGSFATSLGKYAISYAYEGIFGKAYKLIGLDSTNSQAFDRAIVLHKYDKMPYDEDTTPVYLSQGCPMVNEIFFNRLSKIIDQADRKILLQITYD